MVRFTFLLVVFDFFSAGPFKLGAEAQRTETALSLSAEGAIFLAVDPSTPPRVASPLGSG